MTIGAYKNGNYIVVIEEDGTKTRITKQDKFIPSFAENCDVKITDKCSIGCPFCYEGSTKEGKHAELLKWNFLNSLHPYTELAINGNDLDHPELERFLVLLQSKHIFANITVQQSQFLNNFEKIANLQKRKLIYGIGVSLSKATEELISKSKQLDNIVFHTINGVTKMEDYEMLAKHSCKVLILGYKDLRRGTEFYIDYEESIKHNQELLSENIKYLIDNCNVVSFDNLALKQIDVKSLMTQEEWDRFYMGDDGGFTFYIDLVEGKFAKNSLSEVRYDIGELTVDEMFSIVKNS